MAYATRGADGQWVELAFGRPLIIDDIATAYGEIEKWSAEYAEGQGVYVIQDMTIPGSKVAVGEARIEDRNGKPVRVWDLADAPPTDLEPLGSISDRQFFQALASAPYNLITQQEALDAVKTGEIPPIMQAVVDALPLEQQFPVTMILSGGIEYERHNDLVEVFGASQGMTPLQIDDFWRFAQVL